VKPISRILAFLIVVVSSPSLAGGSRPPAQLSVENVEVHETLSLRDTLGREVLLKSPSDVGEGGIQLPGVTPAPDQTLCGEEIDGVDIDLTLRRITARVDLATIYLDLSKRPMPRRLLSKEAEALAPIPVCEPYTLFLRGISNLLLGIEEEEGPGIPSLSIYNDKNLKEGVLELKVAASLVRFRLGKKIDIDRDGRPSVSRLEVDQQRSGQGVGLSIDLKDFGNTHNSEYTTTEACTGTSRRTVCRNGRCEDVSVTWTGERSATHRSSSRTDTYAVELFKEGRKAMSLRFRLTESERDDVSYGSCLPTSDDRPIP
jgi:hypothetical protein